MKFISLKFFPLGYITSCSVGSLKKLFVQCYFKIKIYCFPRYLLVWMLSVKTFWKKKNSEIVT